MNWLKAYMAAIEMAAIAHHGVRRKFTNEPYFVHPLRTSEIVFSYTGSLELACAAVLHDTLEDTDLKAQEIENMFPTSIRLLVESVTKDKLLGKAEREAEYLKRFSTAPVNTVILKLADRFDNIRDLTKAPVHFINSYIKNTTELLRAVPAEATDNYAVKLLMADIVNYITDIREAQAEAQAPAGTQA